MSNQDSGVLRNLAMVMSVLFVFFIGMIFLARAIVY